MSDIRTGEEFAAAMLKIAAQIKQDAAELQQKLAIDGFAGVVRKTARDTFFAVSNWDIVVDVEPPDEDLKNPGGEHQEAQLNKGKLKKIKFYSRSRIYNNTNYVIYLEHGPNPQPMVKPTEQALFLVAEELQGAMSKKVYKI